MHGLLYQEDLCLLGGVVVVVVVVIFEIIINF